MSVKERPRKNKEKEPSESEPQASESKASDQSIDDWLESMSDAKTPEDTPQQTRAEKPTQTPKQTGTKTIEQPQKSPEIATVDQVEMLLKQFSKTLPSWVEKPWMYVKPTHEGHLKSWYQSWKDLILSYSSHFTKHIINLYDLQQLHPFSNSSSNRKLELSELQFIVEKMVDENLAKWLDDESLQARIYYKSDEEWAEIIYRFSIEEGYAAEIMTLFELKKLEQEWTTLPESELSCILDVLVDTGRAIWIGSSRDSIEFIY